MTVTLDPGDTQTTHPGLIEIMGYLGLIGSSSVPHSVPGDWRGY